MKEATPLQTEQENDKLLYCICYHIVFAKTAPYRSVQAVKKSCKIMYSLALILNHCLDRSLPTSSIRIQGGAGASGRRRGPRLVPVEKTELTAY